VSEIAPEGRVDGRRARGDRTRREITERAAEVASLSGLSGVSLHDIARELGISKSTVAAAFGTKQDLEVATIATATEIFVAHVVTPGLAKKPGRPRLRALLDAWLRYVETRVFPGGCFMAAVLPEFDTQPGPVREALHEARAAWTSLLADQVKLMQEQGQLGGELPPDAVAFEIDAVLVAANLDRNLSGDTTALTTARRVLRARLGV
jgi:AcrR family transcriptional regulator